ncbi:MAG: hypothetical protein PHN88_12610 [Ignavibacteria bacterium]|nr:hypothetical protein [Ignavibacteria bacterium]
MKELIVILAAGKIENNQIPIVSNNNNSMLPVNGKPVINWILEDLTERSDAKINIVVREENQFLINNIEHLYGSSKQVNSVILKDSKCILESLLKGIEHEKDAALVQVVLGDTLIKDNIKYYDDFVYAGYVNDSNRWCLANIQNGYIKDLADKRDKKGREFTALAGFYQFTNLKILKESIRTSLKNNCKELSAALLMYNKQLPIKVRIAKEWYDFGHIENFIRSKHKLLQSRFFNSFEIDEYANTLTKSSENNKIIDEYNWFVNIPAELKIFTPRIIKTFRKNNKFHFVQEYYGYNNLAELYIYSDLHYENWISIVNKIFQVHNEFKKYKGNISKKNLFDIYFGKTEERIKNLRERDADWAKILDYHYLQINGKRYPGFSLIKNKIKRKVERLISKHESTIIHGDFCFSNILFDVNNQVIRVVDPRGSFGKKGIYGDPRYDIAKLRHSISGLYDYIITDNFKCRIKNNKIDYKIFSSAKQNKIMDYFDETLISEGYDLDEIKLIEGLLFISMLPYHDKKIQRQILMYSTGIKILNELLNENSN